MTKTDDKTYLAFDTETHRFGPGNMAPKIVCLSYDTGAQNQLLVGPSIPRYIEGALREAGNGHVVLIGQNVAYDMAVLASNFPELHPLIWAAYEAGNVQDTRIRERLLDLAKGNTGPDTRARSYYSLDRLAQKYLRLDIDKQNPWRVRFAELDGKELNEWPAEAISYAKDDAKATRGVFFAQNEVAEELKYDFAGEAARQTSYHYALHLMTCWGVVTDPERVEALSKKTKDRLDELKKYLIASKVMTLRGKKNLTSIRKRVEESFPGEIPRTEKGSIQTTKEVLQKCQDPVLSCVVEYAHLEKLNSTYISKLWEGVEGTIHADFHVLGADTGRTSCSKPNLQNQSRKGGVRECFIARPGTEYLIADYDSQELRTLAQACMDLVHHSNLADRYKDDPNYDPHTDFAALLMGMGYEEAMAKKAEGDPLVKERRQQAKAANFGFPGGLGAKNFRSYAKGYGVDLTEQEAKDLRDKWFEQWPEMKEYFVRVKQISEGSGTLVQLRSGRRRGHVGFTDGANSFFQGLASEASKTAVFRVSQACYTDQKSPLYGCRPVMLIHDEIIVEVPEGRATEAAKELERLMVSAMKVWCPDVPASASPALCKRWTKDAEPVYKDDRLVPWTGESGQEPEEDATDSRPIPKPIGATRAAQEGPIQMGLGELLDAMRNDGGSGGSTSVGGNPSSD